MLIIHYHKYIIGIKIYDFPSFLIVIREDDSYWQKLALMFPCMLNKAPYRGILSTYLSQAIRLLYPENNIRCRVINGWFKMDSYVSAKENLFSEIE